MEPSQEHTTTAPPDDGKEEEAPRPSWRLPQMSERPLVLALGFMSPQAVILTAKSVADETAKLIIDQELFKVIRGRKYVQVEGWQALASQFGAFPQVISTEAGGIRGYVAWAELRTADGTLISRANASCGCDESKWRGESEYAIRSMAETRAVSKVCRIVFGWVMKLAGYEPTPYEEMEGVNGAQGEEKKERKGEKRDEKKKGSEAEPGDLPIAEARARVKHLLLTKHKGDVEAAADDLEKKTTFEDKEKQKTVPGKRRTDRLSAAQCRWLINDLESQGHKDGWLEEGE